MKASAAQRLGKLERINGVGKNQLRCIEHVIVESDGTIREPQVYRDWIGNRWERQPGETIEQFRDRATETATFAAQPRVAVIIGEKLCDAS